MRAEKTVVIAVPANQTLTLTGSYGVVGTLDELDSSGASTGSPSALVRGVTTVASAATAKRYSLHCAAGEVDYVLTPGDGSISAADFAKGARSAAQLAAAPTAVDAALGDGVVFYDVADPTLTYRMNAARTAFVGLPGRLAAMAGQNLSVAVSTVCTFATLPAAADYIGYALVTDVGPHGSMWHSNGVTWGIVGGQALLSSTAVAGAAQTGTGSLVQQEHAALSVPGGLLGLNGKIICRGKITVTNNANTKSVKLYYGGSGGTGGENIGGPGTGGISLASNGAIGFTFSFQNRNSASSQLGSNANWGEGLSGTWGGKTIDSANTYDASLRIELTNAGDSATLESVEWWLVRP